MSICPDIRYTYIWLCHPRKGVRTPRWGLAKVVKFYRSFKLEMIRKYQAETTHHWLDLFKETLAIE
jgi:hypothetical protein